MVSKELIFRHVDTKFGCDIGITCSLCPGHRPHMEDMVAVHYGQAEQDTGSNYMYVGVFDGHGGTQAAQYAKEHTREYIIQEELFWSDKDEDVLQAIRNGFIKTHMLMWKDLGKWPKTTEGRPSTAGTTASIGFIRKNKLYIGHVGDSGILLGYEDSQTNFWRASPLTAEHKPENKSELTRITESGGEVALRSGVARVVWSKSSPHLFGRKTTKIPFLNMSRALGDFWSFNRLQNKFVVSPDPDLSVIELNPSRDRCLIFATDGLWNRLRNQEIVSSISAVEQINSAEDTKELTQKKKWVNPSKLLVEKALQRCPPPADNTSVVTVMIRQPTKHEQEHEIQFNIDDTGHSEMFEFGLEELTSLRGNENRTKNKSEQKNE